MRTGPLSSALHSVLDFLLPTSCAFCRSPVGKSPVPRLCSTCWSDVTPLHAPVCPSCGRPFESPEALAHSPEHICGSCRKTPPKFDQALSTGLFEGPLREAIHQFKYRPCRALGKPLGRWMAEHVNVLLPVDMIMPVPLHRTRLRTRGFNQSLLLAHQVGRHKGIRLVMDNLVRVRATRPQVELNGIERKRNVAGAFLVRRPEEVRERHILLVDDVFTTGATLEECASTLKESGASRVTALTLARAG